MIDQTYCSDYVNMLDISAEMPIMGPSTSLSTFNAPEVHKCIMGLDPPPHEIVEPHHATCHITRTR